MTTNDIDAIRADCEAFANTSPANRNDHAALADRLARDVPALCDEVEQLRKVETGALHMLALAPDEYRQFIAAARASMSSEDYAKNNGRAEMTRVFATGLAERAGLPVPDWERIKRSVPADGVYRAEVSR